ncbi:MAG: exosortase C-terminal domain/associated protein EpsI [Candidatus Omnitrophota bacterium]
MNNKTFTIVIAILCVVTVIGLLSYLPERRASSTEARMSDFPMQIGEWSAKDIPISERDYAILETRNLIMREYKNPAGESVLLYIVYSAGNRKVSHPPEVCYMGSGMTVIEKSIIPLSESISATRMLVEKADSRQLVVYWFRAGNYNTPQYLSQQIRMVLNRLIGKSSSGAMLRLSIDLKDNDEPAAQKTLRDFAALIAPLLADYVP